LITTRNTYTVVLLTFEELLMHKHRRGTVVVLLLMCEVGVTNTEPSEDNSILTVKLARFTIAKGRKASAVYGINT